MNDIRWTQRFIFAFELAWKTLNDKMVHDGLQAEKISPKYIFKLAYANKYISDIELWLAMIKDRNLLSHTYDFNNFNQFLTVLQKNHFPLLVEPHQYFNEEQ